MTDGRDSDEIERGYIVEIHCDEPVHTDHPALIGAFVFAGGRPIPWRWLNHDDLREHGYFDDSGSGRQLKGVENTERFLWGDLYRPKGALKPRGNHREEPTRMKFKFRCSCGLCVPCRYPERVRTVLDTLARHGRNDITLGGLAARLRSTSEHRSRQ